VGDEVKVNMELWHNHTDWGQIDRNTGTIILTEDKTAETLAVILTGDKSIGTLA